MKKKHLIFSMVFIMLLTFFAGCSKNKISNIEIIEESIKLDYYLGENIDINELELKVTLKDNSEHIYVIDKEMINFDNVDNTITGKQNLNISVNYNNEILDFVVEVNFDKKDEVKQVIELINNLPSIDELNLSNQKQLNSIDEKISLLSEFDKKYIDNIETFNESKQFLTKLKETIFTVEVLNNRFVNKNSLTNFFKSLKMSNYTSLAWEEVVKIYDKAIEEIDDDENYNIVEFIVERAKKDILNIKTNTQIAFENYKNKKINDLYSYRNLLDKNNYSILRWNEINNIIEETKEKIMTADNEQTVAYLYNNSINLIDDVLINAEEEVINLENLINTKITELYFYLVEVNQDEYSVTNKNQINEKYNKYVNFIKEETEEVNMNSYIKEFKEYLATVKTIEEEAYEYFILEKENTRNFINNQFTLINIYSYSSYNVNLINETYTSSLECIEKATDIYQLQQIKINFVEVIRGLSTMEEEAQKNLVFRKDKFYSMIIDFIKTYDEKDYSKENFEKINEIKEKMVDYIDKITISDADVTINNFLNKNMKLIEEILTIDEEFEVLLINTRDTAKQKLQKFKNSLNPLNYVETKWNSITSRINYVINSIDELNNIDDINNLVNETINSIS